jgi:hypothetical protein
MTAKPTTVLTWEEWRARLADATEVAKKLIPISTGMSPSGPGQTVLALMIAARALCEDYPALPAFEWYFQRVSELGTQRREREREPPS